MDRLLALVGAGGKDSRLGGADSYCDRLSCTYTVYLLMLFSVLVTGKLFVGDPIACWCPDHFKPSHVRYTNNVCWTTNTYYLPFENEIPNENEKRSYISYYQWIPLILMTQAIMFYLPRPVWSVLNKKSGIAVCTVTDAAIECQRKINSGDREKIMSYITKHMGRYLLEQHQKSQLQNCWKSFWAMLYGHYLYIMYLVVKCLYIVNVIGQLSLLDFFLGGGYQWFGLDVARKMVRGEEWRASDRFPRVTMCDLKTRVIGNVHRYTIMCSLPMNLVSEIVFIFLWFWFVFVACATVASLLSWILWAIFGMRNSEYILTHLAAMEDIQDKSMSKKDMKVFANDFLRRDGRFILKMVANNTSKVLTAELISRLWKYFLENKKDFFPKENSVLEELQTSDTQVD